MSAHRIAVQQVGRAAHKLFKINEIPFKKVN